MKISTCLIVKNEELNIKRCIDSYSKIADEMIVVDTGSTDNTVKIASNLGAKVFYYEWKDDFASARNFALEKAEGDWIIFLDADEYFHEDSLKNVKEIIEKAYDNKGIEAISSCLVNVDEKNMEKEKLSVVRIFRNTKDIRYYNKIHESIKKSDGSFVKSLTGYEDKISIVHTGYREDNISIKAERNLKLLLKELETASKKELIYFHLVSSYASLKDYDNAIKYARNFLESNVVIKDYETFIQQQLLLCMLKRGDDEKCILDEANKFILMYPEEQAFYNIAASIYKSEKKYDKAIEYYTKTIELKNNHRLSSYFSEINTNADIYLYLGSLYEVKNHIEKSVEYYLKSLSENKRSEAFMKLMVLIRQEKPEEIIYILNEIYDINNKEDVKFIVNELSLLKYGKVLSYYHNIWLNNFKEEDSSVIFNLLGNGSFNEAFEILYKCYALEKNPWLQKFLVVSAILSHSEEKVNKAWNIVDDFHKKILKFNNEINFEEEEITSFIDLIEEFILISEDNKDLEKIISMKDIFRENISNLIGDKLFKWKIYDWDLEVYNFYFEDEKVNLYDKTNYYFKSGVSLFYLGKYEESLKYFEKAITNGYGDFDLFEFLNWIKDKSNDSRIKDNVEELKNRTLDKSKKSKLHLGCGKDIIKDWINLDLISGPGVDVVADLDNPLKLDLPFEDGSIEEIYASHLIEHISNPLPLMEELHRVSKDGAKAVFKCPYGSSDEAFEDPTHVKKYFLNSFQYFSQPAYWRADYGYRGDWETVKITLKVNKQRYEKKTAEEILYEVNTYRNVVQEMIVELKAVKPIRKQNRELIKVPKIEISLA